MKTFNIENDDLIVRSKSTPFGRIAIVFLSLPFASVAIGGIQGGQNGMTAIGIAGCLALVAAVHFDRGLRFSRSEKTVESYWSIGFLRGVDFRISTDTFDEVALRWAPTKNGSSGPAMFLDTDCEYESPDDFLLGRWAYAFQARNPAMQLAAYLGLPFVDYCLKDDEEWVDVDEHTLSVGERTVKRNEMELPDRPQSLTANIAYDGEMNLEIAAPGFSWDHFKFIGPFYLGGILIVGGFLGWVQGDITLRVALIQNSILFALSLISHSIFAARGLFLYGYTTEKLRIGNGQLVLSLERPFGAARNHILEINEITGVSIQNHEFAPQGRGQTVVPRYLPMIAILTNVERATFGRSLSEEEQAYLCAVIRARLATACLRPQSTQSETPTKPILAGEDRATERIEDLILTGNRAK